MNASHFLPCRPKSSLPLQKGDSVYLLQVGLTLTTLGGVQRCCLAILSSFNSAERSLIFFIFPCPTIGCIGPNERRLAIISLRFAKFPTLALAADDDRRSQEMRRHLAAVACRLSCALASQSESEEPSPSGWEQGADRLGLMNEDLPLSAAQWCGYEGIYMLMGRVSPGIQTEYCKDGIAGGRSGPTDDLPPSA